MPEHIKSAEIDSPEFSQYLKGFVDSKLKDNTNKTRAEKVNKVRTIAASVAIMLAGE